MASTSLANASSQWWSITDASQTGLDISGDISLEAMVRFSSLPSGTAQPYVLIAKTDTATDRGYLFRVDDSNNLAVEIYGDGTTSQLRQGVSTSPVVSVGTLNTWMHLAATFNITTKVITLYKDGSAITSGGVTIGSFSSIHNSSADFTIGNDAPNLQAFDGQIDYARVWSTERSASEIENNKCFQLTSGTGLVGAWNFENNGNDSVGSNNLTNNNSATFVSASEVVDQTTVCLGVVPNTNRVIFY